MKTQLMRQPRAEPLHFSLPVSMDELLGDLQWHEDEE